jgi:hypothetical protein
MRRSKSNILSAIYMVRYFDPDTTTGSDYSKADLYYHKRFKPWLNGYTVVSTNEEVIEVLKFEMRDDCQSSLREEIIEIAREQCHYTIDEKVYSYIRYYTWTFSTPE